MSTWNSPPQIPPYKEPPFGATAEQQTEGLTAYLKQLANVVSALKNDLEFMLNGNLDVKNIRAKGITADRMDVNELSAISANLGHITAGLIEAVQIFGSYIATRMVGYPRCEMSNTEDLFAAYGAANQHIKMFANGMIGNTPVLQFTQGNYFATQAQTAGAFYFQTSGEMKLQGSNIDLYGNVRINGAGPLGLYGQSYSSASEVSQLVSDFNILLSNLKAMNVIA